MSQSHAHPKRSKYIWRDVPREDPPKRDPRERTADFQEVYRLYDAATVRAQAGRCVECAMPYCQDGCPLGNRIRDWLLLAAEGKFSEAAALSRTTSNMPEICGRICPHERLCEGMCVLNEGGEHAVPIGAIETFINEFAFARDGHIAPPRVKPNGKRVAVVGSGPAGIACADELNARGYAVVVFEAQPFAGGLLVGGIPSFKLEKAVVDRRLDMLRKRGVEFRARTTVGRDVSLAELLAQFDAVFLGMGAQRPKPLDAPGADLQGVHYALPFLVEKSLGPASGLPPVAVRHRHVVVLGGGDTAMDCLRTAIRSGARRTVCIYRRDLANMPGSRREYKNAIEEGAEFVFLASPVALEGAPGGRVRGVRCQRMGLGEPDEKGRRAPVALPDSEFCVAADVVLVAYGFDPAPLPAGGEWDRIARNHWGGLVVDYNCMTSLPRVFAGGDQVRGADLVVHAVRDGRKAASGIHRFLSAKR